MSDRRKRDIGNKRVAKRHRNLCGCWHCEPGAYKQAVKRERVNQAELKTVIKLLGLDE